MIKIILSPPPTVGRSCYKMRPDCMWKKRILHAFFNRRALPQTASEINQKINDNELFAPFGRMHQPNLQPLLVRKIQNQIE